ncbi:serine/threonine-protein kinase [Actinomycetospora sp. C-140]
MDSGQAGEPAEPEQFGPYRLERLLGRGGMGEVFEAVDTRKNRRVAVKRLLPLSALGDDPTFATRFRRESEMAATLQEPHVIPVHDYGEIDGRLFLEMRLVGGDDLAALLRRSGGLPPAAAVDVVSQVADALDAAHRAGLVHRDVKPSNVLLTASPTEALDGRTFAYLVDFGIARLRDGTALTSTGLAPGTVAYMAPERFTASGTWDQRVDVYALGCVLHEALVGAPPFPAGDAAALLHAHLNVTPTPPSHRARVPPGLDAVVARALAKDPAERHASAGELAREARAALRAPAPPPRGEAARTTSAGTLPRPWSPTWTGRAPGPAPSIAPPPPRAPVLEAPHTATGAWADLTALLPVVLFLGVAMSMATVTDPVSYRPLGFVTGMGTVVTVAVTVGVVAALARLVARRSGAAVPRAAAATTHGVAGLVVVAAWADPELTRLALPLLVTVPFAAGVVAVHLPRSVTRARPDPAADADGAVAAATALGVVMLSLHLVIAYAVTPYTVYDGVPQAFFADPLLPVLCAALAIAAAVALVALRLLLGDGGRARPGAVVTAGAALATAVPLAVLTQPFTAISEYVAPALAVVVPIALAAHAATLVITRSRRRNSPRAVP